MVHHRETGILHTYSSFEAYYNIWLTNYIQRLSFSERVNGRTRQDLNLGPPECGADALLPLRHCNIELNTYVFRLKNLHMISKCDRRFIV